MALSGHTEPMVPKIDYRKMYTWSSVTDLDEIRLLFEGKKVFAFDTETNGLNFLESKIAGFSFSFDGRHGYYVPVRHRMDENAPIEALRFVHDQICDKSKIVLMFNKKFDLNMLQVAEGLGLHVVTNVLDVQSWVWLRDTGVRMPSLKDSAEHFLGVQQPTFAETVGGRTFDFAKVEEAVEYAALDAIVTFQLAAQMKNKFPHFKRIFEIDNLAIEALRVFEYEPVRLNTKPLQAIADNTLGEMNRIEQEMHEIAGNVFNVQSGDQLAEALIQCGVQLQDKTDKGKWKLDKFTLPKIKHPLAQLSLEYNKLSTYYSTFVKKLLDYGDEARFNYKTCSVVTGRLSSGGRKLKKGEKRDYYIGANAQNIPKPHQSYAYIVEDTDEVTGWRFLEYEPEYASDEEREQHQRDLFAEHGALYLVEMGDDRKGQTVRQVFVPDDDDSVFVSIDYSGQELRVISNMSGENVWIDALLNGEDLHASTARAVWGPQADSNHRKKAKGINFALNYGGSAYSLSKSGDMTMEEAEAIIAKYNKAMPKLYRWKVYMKSMAKTKGYVTSGFGRMLMLGKHFKRNATWAQKSMAERDALNYPVQGCLQYDTMVLTDEGYIKIGDLYNLHKTGGCIPKKVWTGTSWEEYVPVNRGPAELCDVYFNNGQVLHCDVRHELLMSKGVRVDFSRVVGAEGEQVCFSLPQQLEFGKPVDPIIVDRTMIHTGSIVVSEDDMLDLWWVIGYHCGNGYMHNNVDNYESYEWQFSFGLKDRHYFDRIAAFMKRVGVLTDGDWKQAKNGTYTFVWYASNFFKRLCEVLDTDLTLTGGTRRIPGRLWTEILKHRISFVQGVFAADGMGPLNKSYDSVGGYQSLHLANAPFLLDMQKLLRTVGIRATVYQTTSNSWRLNTYYTPDYQKVFYLQVKPSREVDYKGYVVPEVRRRIVDTLQFRYGMSGVYSAISSKDYMIYRKLMQGRNVSVARSCRLAYDHGIDISDLVYDVYRVVSVKPLGVVEDTFTLAVKSDKHRYDSEGVISKNTGADIIRIVLGRLLLFREKYPRVKQFFRFLSTVHDEVNYSVKKVWLKTFMKAVPPMMDMKLKNWPVPITTSLEIGPNWAKMIPYTWDKETETFTPSGEKVEF